MSVRITHIRKPDRDNRYEAISHYGVPKSGRELGIHERSYLIKWLEDHKQQAYVSEDGDVAWCDIKNNGHIRFLQTRPDASEANNLLSLPPC